jgi:hypothetical protein
MEDLTVDSKNNYAPHLALLAVQFMFGTFPVVGKIALQSFPSFGIVAFRVGGDRKNCPFRLTCGWSEPTRMI